MAFWPADKDTFHYSNRGFASRARKGAVTTAGGNVSGSVSRAVWNLDVRNPPSLDLSGVGRTHTETDIDRAADHLNWAASEARAVHYRSGSSEMEVFTVAGQRYRHLRRQLENIREGRSE